MKELSRELATPVLHPEHAGESELGAVPWIEALGADPAKVGGRIAAGQSETAEHWISEIDEIERQLSTREIERIFFVSK